MEDVLPKEKGVRRKFATLGLMVVWSIGCSGPDELDQTIGGALGNTDTQTAQISMLNLTHEMQRIEVYGLRPSVTIDCDSVSTNAGQMLRDELFEITDRPNRVELFSGQEFSVNPNEWNRGWQGGFDTTFFDFLGSRQCTAVLLRSSNLPDVIVYWDRTQPQKVFRIDAEIPKSIEPDNNTIVMEADYTDVAPGDLNPWKAEVCAAAERSTNWWQDCPQNARDRAALVPSGARYTWRSVSNQSLHYIRPAFETGALVTTSPRCEVPGPGDGLEWESLESDNIWKVLALEEGRDGCHYIRLQGNARTRGWWLCAPIDSLEALQPRDGLDVHFGVNTTDIPGGETLEMWISYTQPEGDVLVDDQRIVMHKGTTFPGSVGQVSWRPLLRQGCAPVEESCGQMSLPVDLELQLNASSENVIVGQGARYPLGDRVFLVRSGYQAVSDSLCESNATDNLNGTFPTRAEFVWIRAK